MISTRSLCVVATLIVAFGCAHAAHPAAAPTEPPAKAAAVDDEAWRNTVPTPGSSREVPYPVAVEQRLKNGVRLYFVQRPAATVNLDVVVRAGASSLPAGKSGLSALAARMLTEGTLKKTALELSIAAESLGSELSENAERDAISVGMEVLPSDVPKALELLAEVIQTPAFREADLNRVRTEWQDQLVGERQEPMRLSSLAALRAVLGPTLGAPVSGSPNDIAALRRSDLLAWHRAQVVPSNTALTIVGNVDPALVAKQATALFGNWSAAAGATAVPAALPAASKGIRVLLVDRPGAVQTAIFAVQPFPKRSEPGYEARQVMTSLFGGLFTSRLNMNLREEHAYTYGARSTLVATRQFGLFALSTSVERDVTAEALEQMLLEVKALRDPTQGHPISADEIQRAKADLSQDLGATLEHTGGIARNVATQFVYDLPLDYFARYKATLAALTPEQITQAAQKVDPAALTLVVAGDRAVIESKIREKKLPIEIAAPDLVQ